MITLSLEVQDTGVIDAYTYLLNHAGEFVQTITVRAVDEDIAPIMLPDFQEEPGPVAKPIEWTSAKQRRYVMMKIRKGEINSVRTHAIAKGWKLFAVQEGTGLVSIRMTNNADGVDFVEGERQQRWHKKTGWFYAPDKIQEWLPIVTDEIETSLLKAFYAVGDNS